MRLDSPGFLDSQVFLDKDVCVHIYIYPMRLVYYLIYLYVYFSLELNSVNNELEKIATSSRCSIMIVPFSHFFFILFAFHISLSTCCS